MSNANFSLYEVYSTKKSSLLIWKCKKRTSERVNSSEKSSFIENKLEFVLLERV